MIPKIPDYIREGYRKTIAPLRTYKYDPRTKRVVGQIEGLEAVKQMVFFILNTEVEEADIYNGNYGSRIKDLYGKSMRYAELVIEGRIREALSICNFIKSVDNFEIQRIDNTKLLVRFDIDSTEGMYKEEISVDV